MKYWLVPCNIKKFNIDECLKDNLYVDWKQSRYKYTVGDFVFIYVSLPISGIRYLMKVVATNIPYEDSLDDEKYWGKEHENEESKQSLFCRLQYIAKIESEELSLKSLMKNGLNKAPQGSQILSEELIDYILDVFSGIDSVPAEDTEDLYEGMKVTISANKYERNPIARQRCIEKNGCICKVCGMDFEKVYGPIGRGFIHVHHIVPISSIGKSYRIDYEKDLVPVCPNCHAMLHKNKDKVLSIEELKNFINKSKNKL